MDAHLGTVIPKAIERWRSVDLNGAEMENGLGFALFLLFFPSGDDCEFAQCRWR